MRSAVEVFIYKWYIFFIGWLKIVSKGKGSIQVANGRTWIYIPKSVAEDSAFPFEKGDKASIEIRKGELIICPTGA